MSGDEVDKVKDLITGYIEEMKDPDKAIITALEYLRDTVVTDDVTAGQVGGMVDDIMRHKSTLTESADLTSKFATAFGVLSQIPFAIGTKKSIAVGGLMAFVSVALGFAAQEKNGPPNWFQHAIESVIDAILQLAEQIKNAHLSQLADTLTGMTAEINTWKAALDVALLDHDTVWGFSVYDIQRFDNLDAHGRWNGCMASLGSALKTQYWASLEEDRYTINQLIIDYMLVSSNMVLLLTKLWVVMKANEEKNTDEDARKAAGSLATSLLTETAGVIPSAWEAVIPAVSLLASKSDMYATQVVASDKAATIEQWRALRCFQTYLGIPDYDGPYKDYWTRADFDLIEEIPESNTVYFDCGSPPANQDANRCLVPLAGAQLHRVGNRLGIETWATTRIDGQVPNVYFGLDLKFGPWDGPGSAVVSKQGLYLIDTGWITVTDGLWIFSLKLVELSDKAIGLSARVGASGSYCWVTIPENQNFVAMHTWKPFKFSLSQALVKNGTWMSGARLVVNDGVIGLEAKYRIPSRS